jgi:hypothetical protein
MMIKQNVRIKSRLFNIFWYKILYLSGSNNFMVIKMLRKIMR